MSYRAPGRSRRSHGLIRGSDNGRSLRPAVVIPVLWHTVKLAFKEIERLPVENAELDEFERRGGNALQECRGLSHADLRAPVLRKTKNARADGRHGNALEPFLRGERKHAVDRVLQFIIFIPLAHSRSDGMDDGSGL